MFLETCKMKKNEGFLIPFQQRKISFPTLLGSSEYHLQWPFLPDYTQQVPKNVY